MAIETAVGRWCLRFMLVLCALLVFGNLAQVHANDVTVDTGIAPAAGEPSDGDMQLPPDQEPPDEPEPGGDLGSPPPTNPPDDQEEREHEAVAPGMVTVILHTSDGGTTADRTMVCVGEICQPAGTEASGIKVVFDRVSTGWHEVSVRSGTPYGGASSSVDVQSGQQSIIELTLVRDESMGAPKEDVTPVPVSATGPLRMSPQMQQAATLSGWNAPVTSLPVTGAGVEHATMTWIPVVLLAIGTAGMLGAGCLRVGFPTRQPRVDH